MDRPFCTVIATTPNSGVRQEAAIGKRIVDAGCRVETNVGVLLLPTFVAALRKDVVDFDGRYAAHLPLEAD